MVGLVFLKILPYAFMFHDSAMKSTWNTLCPVPTELFKKLCLASDLLLRSFPKESNMLEIKVLFQNIPNNNKKKNKYSTCIESLFCVPHSVLGVLCALSYVGTYFTEKKIVAVFYRWGNWHLVRKKQLAQGHTVNGATRTCIQLSAACVSTFNLLAFHRWFSNFSVPPNSLEELIEQIAGAPFQSFWFSGYRVGPENLHF